MKKLKGKEDETGKKNKLNPASEEADDDEEGDKSGLAQVFFMVYRNRHLRRLSLL